MVSQFNNFILPAVNIFFSCLTVKGYWVNHDFSITSQELYWIVHEEKLRWIKLLLGGIKKAYFIHTRYQIKITKLYW